MFFSCLSFVKITLFGVSPELLPPPRAARPIAGMFWLPQHGSDVPMGGSCVLITQCMEVLVGVGLSGVLPPLAVAARS
jgi:hypothetical protein